MSHRARLRRRSASALSRLDDGVLTSIGESGAPHNRLMRRFPPPWTVEKIPGGLKVCDATGQSLAYVYSRETKDAAEIAKVLTEDEARRIASNIAKLPKLLGKGAARCQRNAGPVFFSWPLSREYFVLGSGFFVVGECCDLTTDWLSNG